MIKIKLIKVIIEKEESGNKYNKIQEFEILKNFENWVKYNRARGKLK